VELPGNPPLLQPPGGSQPERCANHLRRWRLSSSTPARTCRTNRSPRAPCSMATNYHGCRKRG